jgi:hypothetical protein
MKTLHKKPTTILWFLASALLWTNGGSASAEQSGSKPLAMTCTPLPNSGQTNSLRHGVLRSADSVSISLENKELKSGPWWKEGIIEVRAQFLSPQGGRSEFYKMILRLDYSSIDSICFRARDVRPGEVFPEDRLPHYEGKSCIETSWEARSSRDVNSRQTGARIDCFHRG